MGGTPMLREIARRIDRESVDIGEFEPYDSGC